MFKWSKGRLSGGYDTITLIKRGFKFWKLVGFDCHIIRYSDGDSIPPHTDPTTIGSHHRINIVFKYPKSGGVFSCDKFYKFGPVIYFRPDLYEHSVSKCIGSRYVLSIGWVWK